MTKEGVELLVAGELKQFADVLIVTGDVVNGIDEATMTVDILGVGNLNGNFAFGGEGMDDAGAVRVVIDGTWGVVVLDILERECLAAKCVVMLGLAQKFQG